MSRRYSRTAGPAAVCLAIAAGLLMPGCRPAVVAREFAITPPMLLVGPPSTDTLHARGDDWRMDIADTALSLNVGGRDYAFISPRPSTLSAGPNYLTTLGGKTLGFRFETAACTLAGAPVVYPRHVNLQLDGRLLQGCGGDPALLLQGAPWRILSIGGQPMRAANPVTIQFGPAGRLTGRLPCGGLNARYTVDATGLRFAPAAAAPGPCPADAHLAHDRLTGALPSVDGFALPAGNRLQLTRNGAPVIDAER